jgi:hypothetical protein
MSILKENMTMDLQLKIVALQNLEAILKYVINVDI